MNMWTAIMVIAIVAITSIARVLRTKHNAALGIVEDRKGRVQMLAQPTDSELQREVLDLRERIKVLERIATEDRHTKAISAEIESLRDR
jgi:hypothetical protein